MMSCEECSRYRRSSEEGRSVSPEEWVYKVKTLNVNREPCFGLFWQDVSACVREGSLERADIWSCVLTCCSGLMGGARDDACLIM